MVCITDEHSLVINYEGSIVTYILLYGDMCMGGGDLPVAKQTALLSYRVYEYAFTLQLQSLFRLANKYLIGNNIFVIMAR